MIEFNFWASLDTKRRAFLKILKKNVFGHFIPLYLVWDWPISLNFEVSYFCHKRRFCSSMKIIDPMTGWTLIYISQTFFLIPDPPPAFRISLEIIFANQFCKFMKFSFRQNFFPQLEPVLAIWTGRGVRCHRGLSVKNFGFLHFLGS